MDETWMMTPECCFSIAGRKPRSRRTAENRFSSNSCCQTASVNASTPPPGADEPPTLLIKMSRPPRRSKGCLDDVISSRARADSRLNEPLGIAAGWDGSGGNEHRASAAQEAIYDGLA